MKRTTEKIWGVLVHLGRNMWSEKKAQTKLNWDPEVWEQVVEKCVQWGLNTIVMDVGEGVQYSSHPELAIEGSWTPEQVKTEVHRLKELGIQLIPKLNFSATHDAWLGIYGRMVSTPVYYQVCRDLIHEAYEIFEHPEYIHIGMDEENWKHANDGGVYMTVIRRDELLIHDIKYLSDCVKETGAKCHMWHDPFANYPDLAHEGVPKDVVPDVWMYYEYRKDHWTKISEQPQFIQDFYKTGFVQRYGYTIEYVEEDPVVTEAIDAINRFQEEGRHFLITTSNWSIKTCEEGAAEYFKKECPDLSLLDGFMTAPWGGMDKQNPRLLESIELLGKAKQIFNA